MAGYIIKNGIVYTPGSHRFEKKDIYIINGKLVKSFPDTKDFFSSNDIREINANGCYVTKGLIDYHVHYFQGGADNGVNPDVASFPNGVTTAVDGGTVGVCSFEIFKKSIIDRADVRLFSQLLVGSSGQISTRFTENIEAEMIEKNRILDMFQRFPQVLTGLKTRLSSYIISEKKALGSLEKTVEIAEQLGCNVTVHITDPAMNLEELVKVLRKNDVICHVFQNQGKECILDSSGRIRPGILDARKRGVLFDACNGKNNFDLHVADRALQQGFFPDIISSDINTCSYYEGVLHSLPKILSKYLAFGQPLDKILDAAILKPALLIQHPELASMEQGSPADICIFKLEEHPMSYFDHTNGKNSLKGSLALVPQMTIKDGKIVYSQVYFE